MHKMASNVNQYDQFQLHFKRELMHDFDCWSAKKNLGCFFVFVMCVLVDLGMSKYKKYWKVRITHNLSDKSAGVEVSL